MQPYGLCGGADGGVDEVECLLVGCQGQGEGVYRTGLPTYLVVQADLERASFPEPIPMHWIPRRPPLRGHADHPQAIPSLWY